MQTRQGFVDVSILTAIIFALAGLVAVPASAQTDDYGTSATSGTYCPQISQTLVRGSTGNQVLELQKFISDYYDISPATIQTGYFGRITQGYVIQFQKAQGLPSYGIVGSLTRAAIARVCNNISVVVPPSPISGSNFTASNTSGGAPLTISFTVNIGNADPHTFYVDSGTGQKLFFFGVPQCSSGICTSPIILTHVYDVGTYTAKLMRTVPVQGENLGEVVITVTTGPNIEKVIKTVGEKESSFLIQKINSDSVDGLWYQEYPISNGVGTPKTLHIGDDIGYGCAGVSEKLISIDYYGQKITFTKIVDNPPMGGCPICLSGSAKIETPDGTIEVKNISAGTSVWTQGLDGVRHKATVLQAGRTVVSPGHMMVDLKLSDGRELVVSPGHPLADGRLVGNLQVGDAVQGARVISTDRVANTIGYTYDILPSGDTGKYWADGILMQSTLRSE